MSLSSPLSLLHEWGTRADGAPLREFLITGFTMNLPFLERVAVSRARALGAEVTLIGDAGQSAYEAVDVRGAGRDYTHALAACQSSVFHPKLALLLGERDVVAAIGSGNPTMSGWGYNDEIWTVLRGHPGGMPWELDELATWLRGLAAPDAVRVPAYMGARLAEVADRLEGVLLGGEPDETRTRVVHNLDRGLIDQLDEGPVDELRVYAPFVDPHAEALRALLDRLAPARVIVGLQRHSGSYDGDALHRVLDGIGAELRFVEEGALRHGKLVEWSVDGQRWALTGSANLTTAALKHATRSGGNCELGTIVPVGTSLMPKAEAAPISHLKGLSTLRSFEGERADVPVLLGAVLDRRALVVTLARAYTSDVAVECSLDGSPDSWTDLGPVRAGEVESVFRDVGRGGLVIRARGPGGAVSNVVFTIDPDSCAPAHQHDSRPRMRRDHTGESLLDEELGRTFGEDLLRLAEELAQHHRSTTPTAPSGERSRTGSARTNTDRWADYLDDCERTFGTALTADMFGHRSPAVRTDAPERPGSRWRLAGEKEEDEDTQARELDEAERQANRPDDVERQKRTWRRRTKRVTDICAPADGTPVPPFPLRLLATRTVVLLLGLGVWPRSDESWRVELTRLARGLVRRDEDIPDGALEQGCLVTAVCAGLLLDGVSTNTDTAVSQAARAVWAAVRGWVAKADPDLDTDLVTPQRDPDARVLSRIGLERIIRLAGDDDPLVQAREELEASGWTLQADTGVHRVHGNFTNPARVAAQVCELLEEHVGTVIVHAQGPKDWALMVWRRPMMLLAAKKTAWRLYRVAPPASPSSRVGSEGISPVGLVDQSAPLGREPGRRILAFLEDAGTDHKALLEKVGYLRTPL